MLLRLTGTVLVATDRVTTVVLGLRLPCLRGEEVETCFLMGSQFSAGRSTKYVYD